MRENSGSKYHGKIFFCFSCSFFFFFLLVCDLLRDGKNVVNFSSKQVRSKIKDNVDEIFHPCPFGLSNEQFCSVAIAEPIPNPYNLY